jgi:HEAT repeat protein
MDEVSEKIGELINSLNSLHEMDRIADLIVANGRKAIPYLRNFLLEGKPSHIYQPRQRAVYALADLGAKEVLIEYLCAPKYIEDPATRFGEEAVENTAARLLAVWQTDDVFEVLLRIAQTRALPGVIEALTSFRRSECISLFIAALMDDFTRNAAENALKAMGKQAKPALMKILKTHDPSAKTETPSNQLRRRSIMRILVNLPATGKDWPTIKKMFDDNDPEISTLAARIALRIVGFEQKKTIVKRLIEKIPWVNWRIEEEIEDCLVEYYDASKKEIEEQISERKTLPPKEQAADRVLQLLLHVQRRAGG